MRSIFGRSLVIHFIFFFIKLYKKQLTGLQVEKLTKVFRLFPCQPLNLSTYNLTPKLIKKALPSAGSAPGPGYPPARRVKYLSSRRLLMPALRLRFLENL